MVSMRHHNNVVADSEQLVKLPAECSCVPFAFNGALGRLLADAGASPHSAKRRHRSRFRLQNFQHVFPTAILR
jgi:hypothetical protein